MPAQDLRRSLFRCSRCGTRGVHRPTSGVWSFRDARNIKLLERLRAAGLQFSNPKIEQASDKFAGTTWVITGTLSQGREEIADIIRANGGKVSGSVSAKTTYLLAGEEAGSKMEKAAKLGVKVLTEADFRAMLGT